MEVFNKTITLGYMLVFLEDGSRMIFSAFLSLKIRTVPSLRFGLTKP